MSTDPWATLRKYPLLDSDQRVHTAFTAIALVCGPPPMEPILLSPDLQAMFVRMCDELFGMRELRDVRFTYKMYYSWYARQEAVTKCLAVLP